MGAAESVSQADAADGFSDVVTEQIAVGGSAWTAVVPVNMVNILIILGMIGYLLAPDVAFYWFNGIDMAYWERPELLGNDSDSSEDCGCSPPGDFDFYDHRDYEEEWERNFAEEWERNFAEGTEGDWLTYGLHEDGEFVNFKDAFGLELAPVALSMGEGAAGQIVFSTSELQDGHGDVAIAPRYVPAVLGTDVCTTGGSDMTMAVFSPDSYDLTCMTVHP